MNPIIKEGSFDSDIRNQVNLNLQQAMGVTTGNIYYLDPLNGSNSSTGLYPSQAVKSLAAGYALLREGKNDVLVLIGNGLTTATARLSSGFTWAKNAAHLVGVCPPIVVGKRARIAPTAGATAFANFYTVSSSGCYFSNIEWFHGFTAGTTAQICLTVSGGRNLFQDCDIQGMGDTDAASAQNSASRSLLIKNTGENTFRRCTIGLDTVLRTTTNSSVEFLGSGTNALPRNSFIDCVFPIWSSSANATIFLATAGGALGIDRWNLVDHCIFVNAIKSTSDVTVTGVAKLGANQDGYLLFKDCVLAGFTGFGLDATTRTFELIEGGTPSTSATGLAVAPTA